jgi:peptide/nickel transport system ATP-binding protein
MGVVGESGCGKSTLARVLMGLIPQDKGSIVFDGELVGGHQGLPMRELRRNMQIVFQDSDSSLNPRLPIVESIAYGPRVHGMPRAEARRLARDLLQRVGLDPALFAFRYPHELSGGQKQRVNIARALALNPRLVILDEAVSALDKSIEAQVLNLLRQLKQTLNLTYVFISHDLNVVRCVSDRMLVMYLGQVVEIGPTDAIYRKPKHPYTEALLESRPDDRSAQPRRDSPAGGRSAQPRRSAERLQIPHALRLRRGDLRGEAPGAGRVEQPRGASGRLPYGGPAVRSQPGCSVVTTRRRAR